MTSNIEQMLHLPLRVVALRDNDAESLARSASGGAFSVLARAVLKASGVVFGAEALPGGAVRHVGVESVEELTRLQGSKYAPSDAAGALRECADALVAGREVLFSGTPCQVFTLRRHLDRTGLGGAASRRLWTVDFICHGVPDPRLFQLYVSWLESKLAAVPGSLRFEFRSKRRGWGLNWSCSWVSSRTGALRSRFGAGVEDPYYAAFLGGAVFRSSCYRCPFAHGERVGDFTIGDFWGVEREHPGFDCRDGASALLMNTARAVDFFEGRCGGNCVIEESSFKAVSSHNENLMHPSQRDRAGEELAAAVDEALARGDAELIFEKLLAAPRDPCDLVARAKRRVRWLLPDSLVDTLKALRTR